MIRFVTGTGLGVGKTLAAAVLARNDHRSGKRVAYLKAVQTGNSGPGDSEFVRAAVGVTCAEALRFSGNLDPAIAAQQAASEINLEWLIQRARAQSGTVDVLYVEGTGGFLTPLTGSRTMGDFASQLAAEVLIVTRPGLGTLNAAALTLEAVRTRALGFGGFIVNRWPESPGVLERTNLERLRLMGAVLGTIADDDAIDTHSLDPLPEDLELVPIG